MNKTLGSIIQYNVVFQIEQSFLQHLLSILNDSEIRIQNEANHVPTFVQVTALNDAQISDSI